VPLTPCCLLPQPHCLQFDTPPGSARALLTQDPLYVPYYSTDENDADDSEFYKEGLVSKCLVSVCGAAVIVG